MIKKILVAMALCLPTLAFAQKFGVCNTEEIFSLMPEAKEVQTKLGEISKNYETELTNIDEELNKKYEAFQALPETTSDGIKQSRMQEIQTLAQRRETFAQTAQQDLARQQQQLIQPVQEKLINAIKAVGAEQGFTMIYPEGVAIYTGTDVIDVTAAVKSKLGL